VRYYTTGTALTLRARVRNSEGVIVNAVTARCRLQLPNGDELELDVRHVGLGLYEADPPTDESGTFRWRWQLTTPSVAAEGQYAISASHFT
jgi:hypothetical protein